MGSERQRGEGDSWVFGLSRWKDGGDVCRKEKGRSLLVGKSWSCSLDILVETSSQQLGVRV